MINFEYIRWKNLLSYGSAFTEIRLDQNRSTIFVGENGSGKSTILEALTFVLYNKPFRNINKPQIVNSINKKNLLVEIAFTIGPQHYKVIRGIRPNIFEVYLNDKLINQDDKSRDYQENLEKNILKMTYKSFCQIVLLGSASYTPFMKLPAASRREIIEDLLDQGIFTVMNTLNKNHIADTQAKIGENQYNIRLVEEKIKMHQKHLDALKQDKIALKAKKVNELAEVQTRISSVESEVEALMGKSVELGNSIQDQQKTLNLANKAKDIENKLNLKLKNIQKEMDFFINNTSCPTCSQDITGEFKSHILECKGEDKEKVVQGIKDFEVQTRKIMERMGEINEINKEIMKINTDIAVHNSTIRSLNDTIKKLNKEIADLDKQLPQVQDDGDLYKSEYENHLKEKEDLSIRADILKDAAIVLKDTGIKARIIKQYVPIINKLINKYLAAMEFFVSFELDETFNETIKSRHRDEFTYESFSEGEKMKINLAILFTWRAIAKLRNSASTNLLIMDEVFDSSLDAAAVEEFMKILNTLNETNIIVISHKGDALIEKFENVIKFEKYKDFSRIA